MTSARARRTPPALALAVTLLAAGCGITSTGVVDGGEPAVGFRPSTRLYFVSGSRLQAAIRPIPWPPLKDTLTLLMDGPSAAERGRGLRSELRSDAETPVKVASDQAKVLITLPVPKPSPVLPVPVPKEARPSPAMPVPVPRVTDPTPREARPSASPSTLGMGQLTCTAASALAARTDIDPDAVTVVIQWTGGRRLGSFRCSEFPRGSE
ncbi:hypothetical protein FHR32_002205 [Streptosporangium album]|uniref:GerMN domain-containing protein n=1 Tax=Streptosporangium album TaxID=47479 RepID=A0A7W7RTJ6_9ACTN|nr:hypothetical protein [Streptosporangium album]MBB4937900.1 hypothetical protein [Streptosporangium album]